MVSKLDWESRKSRIPINFVMEVSEATERVWSIFGVKTEISVVTPAGVGMKNIFAGKSGWNF